MMTFTSVAVLLCSVVALSSACCTPDQWEGMEGSMGGYAGRRRSGLIKEYVQVAYDATNSRTAAFLDYRNGEYSNKFRIVTKYEGDTGKLYVVDEKKDKCWTKTLEKPFRKACIPDSAKEIGDYFMGLDGGFKVSGYEIEGERVNAYVSVEKLDNEQCVPVAETVYGRLSRVGFIQAVGFINITPGIKNATVFDVPSECEEKMDFTLAEELTREHYILAV